MAKRKRLKPAAGFATTSPAVAPAAAASGPMAAPLGAPLRDGEAGKRAPIADVASEASAVAALQEVSQVMEQARDTGRMVIRLDLAEIETDYLVRDRIVAEEEEMAALVTSILERGQQNPIEVVELPSGRFGLISGWRRCEALRRLGPDGPGKVDALLRRPETAADAYQSMVEENEIRVGLSYFERARIAAKAVEQGVFETPKEALLSLFRAASRAKRSKIRSFLTVVDQLEDHLSYPQAIGERLGLALAKRLEADPAFAGTVATTLYATPPEEAAQELTLLEEALKGGLESQSDAETSAPKPASKPSRSRAASQEDLCGRVRVRTYEADGRMELWGEGLTPELRQRLMTWLKTQS